jgi:hypothetical protein
LHYPLWIHFNFKCTIMKIILLIYFLSSNWTHICGCIVGVYDLKGW